MEYNEIKEPRGPWVPFAYVGFYSGILTLVLFWIPFMFFADITGLVLSILGLKSVKANSKAKTGVMLNSIGIGINIIYTILFFTVIIVAFSASNF